MKIRILSGVTALTLAAPAFGWGLETSGEPGLPAPPPPPVVSCTIADNNVTVTSFADILGYQFSGPCTVTFPGTNIKPVTSNYEGGGSWTAAGGAVNEFIRGRDAKGQQWEVRGSAVCLRDPWMTGTAAAGCNGKVASATPNAPHNVFKTMKVPVTAGILDQQARIVLTVKALKAMKLEHNAPGIVAPGDLQNVTFPSNLVISPYLDAPAKTYAVEWQASVNNVWTPQQVFDQAGLKTPLPADKFGASQVWRVRARQHQSAKAEWCGWVTFFVPPTVNPPAGCNNTAAYGATYDVSAMPGTMKAGSTTSTTIKVTNGSNQTWGSGSNYHLSYHWAQNGVVVTKPSDGLRTLLLSAVPPCGTVFLQASVKAQAGAGAYQIQWDMLLEGTTWFSMQGVPTGNKNVTVTP